MGSLQHVGERIGEGFDLLADDDARGIATVNDPDRGFDEDEFDLGPLVEADERPSKQRATAKVERWF